MASTLKAKLFSGASSFPALTALLGTNPFRLYDTQLVQKATFPAVVMFMVSNPNTYTLTGRLPTSWVRVQFTVYGTGNDSQNADAVVVALTAFLEQWSATANVNGLEACPNNIVGDRDGGIANTQPLTYQRFVDVMIFNNDSV